MAEKRIYIIKLNNHKDYEGRYGYKIGETSRLKTRLTENKRKWKSELTLLNAIECKIFDAFVLEQVMQTLLYSRKYQYLVYTKEEYINFLSQFKTEKDLVFSIYDCLDHNRSLKSEDRYDEPIICGWCHSIRKRKRYGGNKFILPIYTHLTVNKCVDFGAKKLKFEEFKTTYCRYDDFWY